MIAEIVKGMINNSTWIDPEKQVVFEFSNSEHLSINGKNHYHYSIKRSNKNVLLKLGEKQSFKLEYVNDFHLNIYNDEEKFKIVPC